MLSPQADRNPTVPDKPSFRAAAVVDRQVIISSQRPDAPPSYALISLNGAWIAYDPEFRVSVLQDRSGREIGTTVGYVYSEFSKDFLPAGQTILPVDIETPDDLETLVLSRISGVFVLLTAERFPARLYPDHAGAMSIVYSPDMHQAASSVALLLDEAEYRARFRADMHQALVLHETSGGWIPGTLTAHQGVWRLLANHYLDLSTWSAPRFWPRIGDFATWRDFKTASTQAAEAIADFSNAVFRNFKTSATLTAGFDTRLVVAGCRENIDHCTFFTVTAPGAEMDVDISQDIAARFGLPHRILKTDEATPEQLAIWDRMAGDCMIEAPRRTHQTLRQMTESDVVLTGLYGEVGRCRYYRQDYLAINDSKIDVRFVINRLTVPEHPDVVENLQLWLDELAGQPNSVILDISLHELKLGGWAMGQRPMTSSVKFAFMPFTQRAVLDAFIGVAPVEKGTKALFWAIINHLWPELSVFPINKYGDYRDYLVLWKKLTNPVRVRRYLRDRFAKKA